MVLTRAAFDKLSKEELISLFIENDDKLNSNMANFTNQLAEVNKTLERMESRLQISKIINNALDKRVDKRYFRRECVEIVGILESTNEIKVCELIEKVTGVHVNQDCLESCHPLHSDYKKTKSESNSQDEKMLKASYKTKTKKRT